MNGTTMTTRHQAIAAVESRLVISTQTMTQTVTTTSRAAKNVKCGQYSNTKGLPDARRSWTGAATDLQYSSRSGRCGSQTLVDESLRDSLTGGLDSRLTAGNGIVERCRKDREANRVCGDAGCGGRNPLGVERPVSAHRSGSGGAERCVRRRRVRPGGR